MPTYGGSYAKEKPPRPRTGRGGLSGVAGERLRGGDHALHDHVVDQHAAGVRGPDVGADAEGVLGVLPAELDRGACHAGQLQVHVLDAVREAGPRRHVLEVVAVAAAREVLREVPEAAGRELVGEGLDEL